MVSGFHRRDRLHPVPVIKLNFINPDGPVQRRNSTLSNCLAAIGELGTAALHRAAVNGFGRLLVSGEKP
jgi:hypothetical protein